MHLKLNPLAGRALVWVYLLLDADGIAAYALYIQVADGHIVTGMRDNVVWGLYIANFIFFIGISYAGAVISGIFHLLHVEWRKPIIRVAELITVIATIIGPIYILLCVGRLDRLHHLVIFTRLQSPITWDVLAISTYLFGGVLFLYLALIKDFAIYRDATELSTRVGEGVYMLLCLELSGYTRAKKIDCCLYEPPLDYDYSTGHHCALRIVMDFRYDDTPGMAQYYFWSLFCFRCNLFRHRGINHSHVDLSQGVSTRQLLRR